MRRRDVNPPENNRIKRTAWVPHRNWPTRGAGRVPAARRGAHDRRAGLQPLAGAARG